MGRKGFNTVWETLEKYGYIQTEKCYTENGIVYQYTINEEPNDDEDSNSLIPNTDPFPTA